VSRLRVGVIGVGYLGKFHAEKYAGMDGVELVGVVDIDPERADKIAQRFGTRAFTTHAALFGKVDAVSVAVPTPIHFAVSKDCLEHDIDVLVEKPIATTLKEAESLIRIAKDKSRIIQVGHLERFNSAVVALKELIKSPVFIESHRLSIYKDRCVDVSVVHDLMIHDIDIIMNFVKSQIERIHAVGAPVITEHVDIANARLEFANGCVANITASRISTRNARKIRFYQKDAYIAVDFANHTITTISQTANSRNGLIPGMEIKKLDLAKGDALQEELTSFAEAVCERKMPDVTGQMGRDALEIALNIIGQIENGNSEIGD
jgi:predicted dehydrogenase